MIKKLIAAMGITVTLYYAMEKAYSMGIKEFWDKFVDYANDHPEMTLAELIFEDEEAV